jgi:hypothetical protein
MTEKLRTKNEAELARPVVAWLESQGWEVWQEVRLFVTGPRADIVAMHPLARRTWVVEVKVAFTWELLDQALEWKGYANFVSVAVPRGRPRPRSTEVFLRHEGLGLLTVGETYFDGSGGVKQDRAPDLFRVPVMQAWHDLRARLTPETKGYGEAGTQHSAYYTPYRQTCKLVLELVTKTPGLTVKDVVAGVDHHYSRDATARSCLLAWANAGKIPGVRTERDGRRILFFPT